jgi:hypothetical protein
MIMAPNVAMCVFAATCLVGTSCAHLPTSQTGSQREALQQQVRLDPTNVHVHLALARYDADHNFPSSAMLEYQIVQQASGLIAPRWSPSDVVRYRELLLQRGQRRIRNQWSGAIDDLLHAKQLGAGIATRDEFQAEMQRLIANARHSDDRTRQQALRELCRISNTTIEDKTQPTTYDQPIENGACPISPVTAQQQYARWLWQHGANRASYDVLAALPPSVASVAIEDLKRSPGDRNVTSTWWLEAMQWWQGRVVPLQWRAVDACDALRLAVELFETQGSAKGVKSLQKRALLEISTPSLSARNECRQDVALVGATSLIAVWLGEVQTNSLENRAWPMPPDLPSNSFPLPQVDIVGVFAKRWHVAPEVIAELVAVKRVEPGTEGQLQQWVDRQIDAVEAAGIVAEWLYVHRQYSDSQRWWQRAVDSSSEPWFAQGLAVAAAANGDAPAAMVWAQRGAAAWGDPAAALLEVGLALAGAKQRPEALTILRQALSLSSAALRATIEVAIDDSLSTLGRAALFLDPLAVPSKLTSFGSDGTESQRDWRSREALLALSASSPK